MEIYKLKNISKIYESSKTKALDNISLNIKKGEIVVILGPSGSGKSTLLNILSGIDTPSKGEVLFNDENISKLTRDELTEYRRNNIGFIFQSYNLVSNLNIYENIELGYHLSKKGIDIDKLLKTVDLQNHKNKYPYALSGGQMQRVAIARALSKNPEILFCDEPTGALDEKTGKNVLKTLQEINKEYKTTMIIVTHNPSIALMANTVIKMNSGVIKEIIKNKEVTDAESLRWA